MENIEGDKMENSAEETDKGGENKKRTSFVEKFGPTVGL